ncbi:coiled-coil domain-containing protein 167 isoform X2 [Pogoniulus pusillus]|uniref:coiled-coil domain-containing protein 167 isoform X2 n=1 Tax=Pogoniulus pusillus TaxID=488313 RepID=UPI0030B93511
MAAARTWRSRAAARGGSVRMRGRRRRDHGREASGAERGPGGERRPAVAGRGRARLMDWRRSWRTADRAWRRWILNCKGRSSVLKEGSCFAPRGTTVSVTLAAFSVNSELGDNLLVHLSDQVLAAKVTGEREKLTNDQS